MRETTHAMTLSMAAVLAVTSLGTEAACTAVSRTCTETNAAGRCLRYTNTFKCVTEHPDKNRCQVPARSVAEAATFSQTSTPSAVDSPVARSARSLDGCWASGTVCSKRDADGLCLETETSLTCNRQPSGAGVTVGAPEVSFEWTTTRHPNINPQDLGAGCRITSTVCTDSRPRQVPIANAPGETATASPEIGRAHV